MQGKEPRARDSSVPSVRQRDRQRDAQEGVKGVALLLAMRARQGGPGTTWITGHSYISPHWQCINHQIPYSPPADPTGNPGRVVSLERGEVTGQGQRQRQSALGCTQPLHRKSSRQESILILQNSILIQSQSAPYNGFVS